MTSNEISIKTFVPGFSMGITRALVSHPFEILKIKSQLNLKKKVPLFKGLHYSLLASGIERGIQFGLYDFFKNNNDSNLVSSLKASALSTCIGIPYNFYIVNKSVVNQKFKFNLSNLSKTIPLEYSRSYLGSVLFLYTYNELKNNDVPLWLSAFGGTTSVWSITYPLDNIRNQIISKNNNFTFKNLYKGIQYPVLRSIPSSIAGMYVYEFVKNFI
tara:strand:+ start:1011 stop:1655 length:645 start_codon:yes stop_codon:yes gene_type:complete